MEIPYQNFEIEIPFTIDKLIKLCNSDLYFGPKNFDDILEEYEEDVAADFLPFFPSQGQFDFVKGCREIWNYFSQMDFPKYYNDMNDEFIMTERDLFEGQDEDFGDVDWPDIVELSDRDWMIHILGKELYGCL